MELFSPEFFSALAAIVVIDLVLAGDNAIVIALAARRLPDDLRKRAILLGTAGAIIIRSLMTLGVVWLLKIPGLMAIGGVALIYIAYKLLVDSGEESHNIKSKATLWGALQTIVVADLVMGIDNVLAVAGAAHGSFALVVFGLLLSIPIVVWGSQFVLKMIERFPAIIYFGGAVLAWTAAKMVLSEPLFAETVANLGVLKFAAYVLAIGGVLGVGYLKNRRNAETSSSIKKFSTVSSN